MLSNKLYATDINGELEIQMGQSGFAAKTPETIPMVFERTAQRQKDSPALWV